MERGVHRDLLIVDAQAMTLAICIAEEASLQHRIGRRRDTRDKMSGREGKLLDLGKIVLKLRIALMQSMMNTKGNLYITIEGHLSNLAQRYVLLWPDLCNIKDIPPELLGLCWVKYLSVQSPRRVLASIDGVEEILGVPIWIRQS